MLRVKRNLSFIFTRRLAKEAAKTIEDMRKATEKELNEAKQKLEKEKEDALKKLKEQYKKEQDNEEERLRKEHDAVMKTLGEKAREDALEEEAMLQEGKQNAMRKLKQQIQREQDEEEAALRKKKDEALDLIREELQVWAVSIIIFFPFLAFSLPLKASLIFLKLWFCEQFFYQARFFWNLMFRVAAKKLKASKFDIHIKYFHLHRHSQ